MVVDLHLIQNSPLILDLLPHYHTLKMPIHLTKTISHTQWLIYINPLVIPLMPFI